MSTHPLVKLLDKTKLRVVGLMSGTSLDGIDVAVVDIHRPDSATRFNPQLDLIAFRTIAYADEERARLTSLLDAPTRELSRGSFWLGERFFAAMKSVLDEHKLTDIDLIGSHGQTVWHEPPSMISAGATASTLQIGEPAVIAARSGIVTVGDFRVADVAVGGEGAPLVPFLDWVRYAESGRARALQNIGGIANVTFLDGNESPIAFDNGPGNMILDEIVWRLTGEAERCDRDGIYSAMGKVNAPLLAELLADPYLKQSPPKSTGRERYGRAFVEQLLNKHPNLGLRDVLRTAVTFTATAIVESLALAHTPIDELLVSGGGVHNPTLMAELRKLCKIPVHALDEGHRALDPDAKEAVAFALFAACTLWAKPAGLPSVTGARKAAVLGKICLP